MGFDPLPLQVGANRDREVPGRARGHAAGNSRTPGSRHRTAPAAGWGDPGDCRCPFPVEGRRARVVRGGKERRPFRRLTARVTVADSPGAPLPSWPGAVRARQPRERDMPPAVPQARNWGHWATGPVALGWGHRCTDLPELERELPGRLGVHTLSPAPGLELSSPRTLSPHLNPFLTFLAERAGNSGTEYSQASCWPGFTSFTVFHRT